VGDYIPDALNPRAESADLTGRMEVRGTERAALRACWWAAGLLLAVFALQAATGLADEAVTGVFQDYLYNGLLFAGAGFCIWRALAFREERGAWLAMGAGIASWTAADVVWTVTYADDTSAPYPSVADGLWLAYCPAACAGRPERHPPGAGHGPRVDAGRREADQVRGAPGPCRGTEGPGPKRARLKGSDRLSGGGLDLRRG
jgi:hypothetical protein